MKKTLMFVGLIGLFAAPAFAQTEKKITTKNSATGAKTTTEIDVRENGTVKVETDARTGRTKAGEVINDAAHGTKETAKKVAHGTEHAAKKVAHGTEHVAKKAVNGTEHVAEKTASGAKTAGKKAVHATEKTGQKIDEKAEKGIDKVQDAVD